MSTSLSQPASIPDLDPDLLREFLIETSENLARLDNEIVDLEKRPKDAELLASIFRTVHTIKGTCGFLGFTKLEAITHEGETILSQVRAGQREVTPGLITLVLEVMDATRRIMSWLERNHSEGPDSFEDLVDRLREASLSGSEPVRPAAPESEAGSAAGAPGGAAESGKDGAAPGAAAGAAEGATEGAAARGEGARGEGARGDAARGETGAAGKAGGAPEGDRASGVADSAIRVDVGLLDRLMNMVGELVLVRNQVLQHGAQADAGAFHNTAQRLNLITSELQEGVMKTRMQPIGLVFGKLPRVVRDLSHSLGKQIKLEMEGAETELDKTIIEAIKDPLTHLVRNSCDHGVERPEVRTAAGKPAQGRILLRAYHEGGQVIIEIDDDGAGIDPERVKKKALEKGLITAEQAQKMGDREACGLIFAPGFSTAAAVTNVSGRGVGMDVVKSNIEKIGGMVDIINRVGAGATVRLKIPLTLAIIPGLVVESAGNRFVIPQVSLLELIRLEGSGQIETIQGTRVYRRRGTLLPIVPLAEVLALPGGPAGAAAGAGAPVPAAGAVNLIVLQTEERLFGLVVDRIHDTQEIVVKPLSQRVKGLAVYAGATIMGDGRVALILDVTGVAQRAGLLKAALQQNRSEGEKSAQGASTQRWLLLRVGASERVAIPISVVSRLEEVPRERIERAGGREVLQYRGRILPLVSLSDLLGVPGDGGSATVPTIVFEDGRRAVGVMVEQILDVVEEAVTVRQKHDRAYLLGSAVLGGEVTDLVNLRAVLEAAVQGWRDPAAEGGAAGAAPAACILVAEPSALERGLVRGCLEMGGHEVWEAGTVPEMLRQLEHRPVDLVLAAPEWAESALNGRTPATPWLPLTDELLALGDAILEPVDRLLRSGGEPRGREDGTAGTGSAAAAEGTAEREEAEVSQG